MMAPPMKKKTILIIVAIIVATAAIFFGLREMLYYVNTRVTFPANLSATDRQYYEQRYHDILSKYGPDDWTLYNEIGSLRSALGDYVGAAESFQVALRKKPIDPVIMRNLAVAYVGAKQYASAVDMYKRLYALVPTQPEYWSEVGTLYTDTLHDNDQAKLFYETALNQNGQNVEFLKQYADFLSNDLKSYDKAIDIWNQVISLDPPNADAYRDQITKLKQLQAQL